MQMFLNKSKKQQGFTLVEISIVLVIIGVLMGALLRGSAMIRSTKVKATLSEMNNVKRAALMFRDRFGSYPGDFGRARNEVLNCVDATSCENGNNDGKVVSLGGASDPDEEVQFWKHMYLAGVRENETFDSPLIGATIRIYYDEYMIGGTSGGYMGETGKHWLILEPEIVGSTCCLSLDEQQLIDMNMDDGDLDGGGNHIGNETGNVKFYSAPLPDAKAPKQSTGLDIRDGSIAIALD